MIEIYVDFKIKSPNVKEHWSKTLKRSKSNYLRLICAWRNENLKFQNVPCSIKINRLYNPRKREKKMDYDNFVAACKGIRDQISDLIYPGLAAGQADNEEHGIKFEYAQEESERSTFKINIEYVK